MSIYRHLKQTRPPSLIQIEQTQTDLGSWTVLKGPRGAVRCWDIGLVAPTYYADYPDRLEELYELVYAVLDGHYHCCLTGKIFLA